MKERWQDNRLESWVNTSVLNSTKTHWTTDVYECSRRTARLVIPRDRTPLRSCSTFSRSSSLHTSSESPVLPEGHQRAQRDYQDYFKWHNLFRECAHPDCRLDFTFLHLKTKKYRLLPQMSVMWKCTGQQLYFCCGAQSTSKIHLEKHHINVSFQISWPSYDNSWTLFRQELLSFCFRVEKEMCIYSWIGG